MEDTQDNKNIKEEEVVKKGMPIAEKVKKEEPTKEIVFDDDEGLPSLDAGNEELGKSRNPQLVPTVKDGKIQLPIGSLTEVVVVQNGKADSKGFFEGIQRCKLKFTITGLKEHKDKLAPAHNEYLEPIKQGVINPKDGKDITNSLIDNSSRIIQEMFMVCTNGTEEDKRRKLTEAAKQAAAETKRIVLENGWYKLADGKAVPNVTEEHDEAKCRALRWHENFKQTYITYAALFNENLFHKGKEVEDKVDERGNPAKYIKCYWHIYINNDNRPALSLPPFVERVIVGTTCSIRPLTDKGLKYEFTAKEQRKVTMTGMSGGGLPPIDGNAKMTDLDSITLQ